MSEEFDVFGSFTFTDESGEFIQEGWIGSVELELTDSGELKMPEELEINGVVYKAQF
jgi:hypothetical protein